MGAHNKTTVWPADPHRRALHKSLRLPNAVDPFGKRDANEAVDVQAQVARRIGNSSAANSFLPPQRHSYLF
jgi:hypothetical protein